MKRPLALRACALLACAVLAACVAPAPETSHVSEGRPAMGTVLEITLVAADRERARAAISRCFAEAARLEAIFTTWRADGELARLNAQAGSGPQPASPELMAILLDARDFARETGGAFDVTVGSLTELWREAEARGVAPSAAEIASARARLGFARIALDPARGEVTLPAGAVLDLGGIAKGWALDRLGELLRREGFERALLNFGGSSLLALRAPADGESWRVRAGAGPVLALRDVSVSISESFGQSLEIAGGRFSHIVDPRSGANVAREQRAIVLAENGAVAEAWSTALIVLAPEAGVAAARARGEIEARVDDGSRALAETPAFAARAGLADPAK
jgi:thiamine biosynthesis lipoprotein